LIIKILRHKISQNWPKNKSGDKIKVPENLRFLGISLIGRKKAILIPPLLNFREIIFSEIWKCTPPHPREEERKHT
jgi:hypothetical protein